MQHHVTAPELSEVDRLVATGQLAAAADLLEAYVAANVATAPLWLQLGGLRRRLKQPHRALAAVHAALAIEPLDFMALLMRASLLQRLSDPDASPAWERALAQLPDTPLPPPIADTVTEGQRIVADWRAQRRDLMDQICRDLEPYPSPAIAWKIGRFRQNMLRETKIYRSSPTHFHYPDLLEREFHPADRFPWLKNLEDSTDLIREELQALLVSPQAALAPYIQYDDFDAMGQWRTLNNNRDWSAIHLLQNGHRIAVNANACPGTMALLDTLPQPVIDGASPNAMFSLLAPNTVIPPHVGVNNARLVCHLPLVIPAGCWFRVGNEVRQWQEGTAFVFDDTIEHEAANPTDAPRIVLIFDLWHPDLSPAEQAAIARMIAAEAGTTGGL